MKILNLPAPEKQGAAEEQKTLSFRTLSQEHWLCQMSYYQWGEQLGPLSVPWQHQSNHDNSWRGRNKPAFESRAAHPARAWSGGARRADPGAQRRKGQLREGEGEREREEPDKQTIPWQVLGTERHSVLETKITPSLYLHDPPNCFLSKIHGTHSPRQWAPTLRSDWLSDGAQIRPPRATAKRAAHMTPRFTQMLADRTNTPLTWIR